MRKAISELVVIVMLLMISIVLVGLAFVFISGFQEQAKSEVQQTGTESFKTIGSCLQTVSFDEKTNNLWVKNCGKYPLSNFTVMIDNVPAYSDSSLVIEPNKIKSITIYAPSGTHEVKLLGDYASAATSVTVTKSIDFDFSLSLTPSSGSVVQGSNTATAVTATLIYGTPQSVSLSCSKLPTGASCSFGTNPVTPSFSGASSSLTISTLVTTPTGTYPINIGATGTGIERNATYTLTVSSDIIPPAAISDLSAGSPNVSSITLSWTAPGDDGNIGTASQYDIRYSTSAITESGWASATQVSGEPAPKAAGSAESFTAAGLNLNTTYYFAIKTADEVPNWSGISNSPSAATLPPKIVFVSSATYNGSLGGLSGADSKCQALASAVPALSGKTFKAWLSNSTLSAKDRLTHSTIPYVRTDGVVVANNWTDLVDGSLQNAINVNENKTSNGNWDSTFTKTATDGSSSGGSCVEWTSSSGIEWAGCGDIRRTNFWWTIYPGGCKCDGSVATHLYCFEQ